MNAKLIITLTCGSILSFALLSCDSKREEAREENLEQRANALENKADQLEERADQVRETK
jgi:hypothetical protein